MVAKETCRHFAYPASDFRPTARFCQRGSNFENVLFSFLVDEGREDPNTTIRGPSLAHQRNASTVQMAFRWRADDGLTLNAGLVALEVLGDLDQYC